MEETQQDICRVCRSEAAPDKPLFYPCVCTGSIKYIHQECLVQWLKYSKKEYCELCKHRFAFTPIYSPDMPKRLPVHDIFSGLLKSVAKAVRYWLHYTLVAIAWLAVVPLTACRIYRCLFAGSISAVLTLPLDMLSTENLVSDCFQGCFVVTCTLCAFISLVWLREQILHGGGPDWLEADNLQRQNAPNGEGAIGHAGAILGGVLGNNRNAPAAAAANQNAGGGNEPEDAANNVNVAQDEAWNPMEWDRAAEELTWERLLGLDGSLVFLEHVFWVVSLNTLFILVFAFCPYHIGQFTVVSMKGDSWLTLTQFQGLLATLLGYCIIAVALVILHTLVSLVRIHKFQRVLGLCYIVVKVSLLVVVEIGIFPLVCGWWLDICSLNTFDATLKDRINSFRLAPGTSMFIHWLVGMVYVFYFASFILLLREVLRPGVLWFLRNLNDPEFNPIQEMIHLPMYRHVRRFLASMVIFGSTVLVMLWLPVRVIQYILPSFLPYNVLLLSSDMPVSELSLELLLLQVVLPALLEQGHTRQWLKRLVRVWCVGVARLLNLRSYLLGDAAVDEQPAAEEAGPGQEGEELNEEGVEPHEEGVELHEEGVEPNEEIEPMDGAAQAVHTPPENTVNEVANPEEEGLDVEGVEPVVEREEPVVERVEPAVEALEPFDEDAVPDLVDDDDDDDEDAVPDLVDDDDDVEEDVRVMDEVEFDFGDNDPPRGQRQGLAAAHQALLQPLGPVGFQPYNKTDYFSLKIALLLMLMASTLFLASLVSFIIPVYLGRKLMSIWMGDTKIHELYTAACGLYACWVTLRLTSMVYNWVPQGHTMLLNKAYEWSGLAFKSLLIASVLVGLVPLLLGLLFQLVVVAPIRVPLDQNPVFYPWQDWALGVLHAKIICAVTMMGPQWWLKHVIEQVYNQGLRNMDLMFILYRLCLPLVGCLGLCLTMPYMLAHSLLPVIGANTEVENLVWRRVYPFLLFVTVLTGFIVFQMRQFKRLYEHIKNDKYLVGQRLVNYDRRRAALTSRDSVTP